MGTESEYVKAEISNRSMIYLLALYHCLSFAFRIVYCIGRKTNDMIYDNSKNHTNLANPKKRYHTCIGGDQNFLENLRFVFQFGEYWWIK